ncbi:hypothetical protein [Tropicimonas sediminicola]|uniref:Uncharacterized protein n=1 Tax=Tropicimonas sediminicola TaxID=1031541 RepID=A0A239MGH7_9RHOB|nr:hypothetical protein [Tropicimonas sediminicola]SNT41058.1 hypothetical protein SAMN05421757_1181 [Tropicimonas sediminicola]
MGKVLIGVIGLVVGLVGGAMFGGAMIGGTAAGVGIATGLSAGVCSTIGAAEAEGLLTPEQADQVLTRAAADMAQLSGVEAPGEIVGSTAECEGLMERLSGATAE